MEEPGGTPPQRKWLFIVRRDQARLYEHLRQAFAGSPVIEVILDRRRGERRHAAKAVPVDRRRGDRRWPVSPSELDLWEAAGFRLVLKSEEIEVYESWSEPGGRP